MNDLQCLIVDDEPLPLELLTDYIGKVPFLALAGAHSNPLEALFAAQQKPIDLIFLDIQMPELSGLQFMQLLQGRSKVIITTAYPDYALQGYEFDVIDYLLKPVSFERFLKAVNKAALMIHPPQPGAAATIAPPEPSAQVLFVKSDYRIIKVIVQDILFIEGLKEYIAIHTSGGKIITLQNIKKMEEVLSPAQFVRVHKSYIVAIGKIGFVEKNRIFIGEKVIPIGETYKESFLKILNSRDLL